MHMRGPGTPYALTDSSPSGCELALAHVAAANKWTFQQAADLIVLWRNMHFPGEDLPDPNRIQLTLIRAFVEAKKNGRIRKKKGRSKGSKNQPKVKTNVEPESSLIHPIHDIKKNL